MFKKLPFVLVILLVTVTAQLESEFIDDKGHEFQPTDEIFGELASDGIIVPLTRELTAVKRRSPPSRRRYVFIAPPFHLAHAYLIEFFNSSSSQTTATPQEEATSSPQTLPPPTPQEPTGTTTARKPRHPRPSHITFPPPTIAFPATPPTTTTATATNRCVGKPNSNPNEMREYRLAHAIRG